MARSGSIGDCDALGGFVVVFKKELTYSEEWPLRRVRWFGR